MIIYIDSDFHCYTANNGTMREIETDFFDGKCQTFIEGYRFIPKDDFWRRNDGVIFQGEQIIPWKKYSELNTTQRQYEQQEINRLKNVCFESETIIAELDAALLETTYQSIINEI